MPSGSTNRATLKPALQSDPTLPGYYRIKNHLLIASLCDSWDEADEHIEAAEVQYALCMKDARAREDANALKALEKLRAEFDMLKELRREYLMAQGVYEGVVDESPYDTSDSEDAEQEEAEAEDLVGFEDSKAVSQAENEREVIADTMRLPIRTTTNEDIDKPGKIAPAINVVAPPEPTATVEAPKAQGT
ncbi:uncharacterized protein EI97DRAFT_437868 [Westerdykella ornata]|uniref:Uncharacterized protein n=1 Tax=Westerdykella ornata TaxID=318751 RepID=A0A6A6J5G9_WESOR|nr:uncharacterized protein EI97DRAFT_437868 [Westerdykella ornata]KAF2271437.1 hypothetical protein EI97DRAFT_437868 [Westerdykella ornata]